MRHPDIAIIGSREHDLSRWLERLRHGTLATDTETTGLKWDVDRVGGLCLAAGHTAIYAYGDALGPTAEWFADQLKANRQVVFHNAKFDIHMLRSTFGIPITKPVDDTMVMSFLLDQRGAPKEYDDYNEHPSWHPLALSEDHPNAFNGNGLKTLAASFIDRRAREPETELYDAVVAAGGSRGKDTWKGDILLAPPKIVGKYGCMDAWYTLKLHQHFEPRLRHWVQPEIEAGGSFPSLWSLYETERWVTLALVEMEQKGVLVDADHFEKWQIQLEDEEKKILHRLEKIAKKEINWGSAPQLRELLYNDLGIPITRRTKSNLPSTDEVALIDLPHPIGRELLLYRDNQKQLTTYARGLLNAIRADGRIHPTFRQIGARTGRLSCVDPNLQQVPRESGARRGFIPDKGLKFRFADYSQAEMRFAAHGSGDETLINGFRNDPKFDTHMATAMKMWGLTTPATKQQRKFAKILNFAMLYGAGENNITQSLISLLTPAEAKNAIRELGAKIGVGETPHRKLAKLLLERYFREMPALRKAKYRATDEAERRGFSMNYYGRHRFLSDREAYKALNSEIQGSAVDLSKAGMVNVFRELQQKDGSIAMILQIHDEIVYLSEGDPAVDRKVLELMDDRTSFKVPIIADVSGSDTSWQDKVSINLGDLAE